jgi:hypothetical protein
MGKKKARTITGPGVPNYYPAGAVKVDLPFPSGNGRVTAIGASDFQLRPAILPNDLAPSANNIGPGITPLISNTAG